VNFIMPFRTAARRPPRRVQEERALLHSQQVLHQAARERLFLVLARFQSCCK
jgi:hypothetical protein